MSEVLSRIYYIISHAPGDMDTQPNKGTKKGGVNVIVISRDYGEDINLRRTFDDQSLTGELSQ